MKYINLSFSTPQDNLACDEALIDLCEGGYDHEILRFWEPREHFVVLGYSNKINSQVNMLPCQTDRIPILRRCSGGGAVLQGPGCLNYSLILKLENSGPLTSITESYTFVMGRHKDALEPIIGAKIEIQGFSDLTIERCKFSGNAQHRRRNFLLFHGTFLLNFDISMVEKTLPLPSRQPPYRQNRSHRNFLINLYLPPDVIKETLKKSWGATEELKNIPFDRIKSLVSKRYATDEWNLKF